MKEVLSGDLIRNILISARPRAVSALPRAAEYTIGISKEKAKKPKVSKCLIPPDPSVHSSFIISVGNLSF